MTSKNLLKKVENLYTNATLYKGHTMSGEYGWVVVPFGENEIFLGRNLREAHEEIDNKVNYKEEQS